MIKQHPREVVLRAVDNVSDIVEITDVDGRFEYVNRAFELKTGWSCQEALGHTPAELLRSDVHSAEYYQEIWETINSGESWKGRMTSRAKDGSHIIQEAFITPVLSAAGEITHFIAIKRDVTDRVQMEARLLEADRLAAVGQLAAGIAHEVNNPLTYLLANLRFMRTRLEALDDAELTDEFDELLEEASFGARQIKNIIRDLGAMTRRAGNSQPVDVTEVLGYALHMAASELGADIEVVENYDDVPPVEASRSRLVQVFLNLAGNAIYAIREADGADQTLTVSVRPGEDTVIVEFTDTGCGIANEDLEHIFEPFYSTRQVGEGTGLGLWVCYGIVTLLGGSISVDSEPGKGATFEVVLPAATPAEASAE
jgi:PAS domain S-box-containing protein